MATKQGNTKQDSRKDSPGSRREALERLIEDVREDPGLLHALLFEPEKALSRVSYLGRREKGSLVAIQPEFVIAGLAGLTFGAGGGVSVCGESCTDSCSGTCGAGSCYGTCYSSCDSTCGNRSCDITTEIGSRVLVDEPWEREGRFGRRLFRAWQR